MYNKTQIHNIKMQLTFQNIIYVFVSVSVCMHVPGAMKSSIICVIINQLGQYMHEVLFL